jgi:4a-hydroxytetrahydrobiopterin dehydratase
LTVPNAPHGWQHIADAYVREFAFATFADAAAFVAVIGRIADDIDHHPEVALRYPGIVTVHTTSHDTGAVTKRDVRLAELVNAAV